jgi:hypothetical protein
MNALFLSGQDHPKVLARRTFAAGGLPSSIDADAGGAPAAGVERYDEAWLQDLLYRHPGLMLLCEPGADQSIVAPLCRELAIPRPGGNVFLDILGVTRSGRLVLVECKLWRNPQARREVVAQILEYAALLRSWSFGDLTARIKQKTGSTAQDPIFELARQSFPDLDEAAFVDGVARSLEYGDFHLVIAGDGIRSDLHSLAKHLNAGFAGLGRLSLLEIQLWSDSQGNTVVVPNVPLKTEIIEQRVVLTDQGMPVKVEEVSREDEAIQRAVERVVEPEQAERRAQDKAFWQSFIDSVRFDHPDQPPPRHGGPNWVKIPQPGPVEWLTAFRSSGGGGKVGLFLTFRGGEGQALFDELAAELETLRTESDLDLQANIKKSDPFEGEISATRPRSAFANEREQLAFLTDAANRFVTTIRPRLAALSTSDQL